MKSFIIALSILVGLIVLILINSAAMISTADELLLLCRQTADGSAPEAADLLLSRWEHCRDFLSLSVHYRDIEAANTALYSAMSTSDPVARDANLNLFAAALRQIADSQRFDFFNIF